MLPSLISELDKAHYHHEPTESPLFSAHGIAHGFIGKQAIPLKCHHLQQVHGAKVVQATDATAYDATVRSQADGLFSRSPADVLAIKTADCLPVLFYAPGFIGAAHAGWRGLTQGVLSSVVEQAKRQGVSPATLYVAIGPAIAGESYEVGPEVVMALHHPLLHLNHMEVALCLTKLKKWHVNLKLAAHISLLNLGILPHQISVSLIDTFMDERFYSFRREGKQQGSNWSWIQLPKEP
jgi:hypothetical protein